MNRDDDATEALVEIHREQMKLHRWVRETFGEKAATDRHERIARLLEEVVELAQAESLPSTKVQAIVARVYGRPMGDPRAEVGGVAVTLLAYLASRDWSFVERLRTELDRIYAIPKTTWEKRHAQKAADGIAIDLSGTARCPSCARIVASAEVALHDVECECVPCETQCFGQESRGCRALVRELGRALEAKLRGES